MKTRKSFSSFEQVDQEMEILQLKRKIHRQKILLDVQNIQSTLNIEYFITESGKKMFEKYTRKSGGWLATLAPIVLNIIQHKRNK